LEGPTQSMNYQAGMKYAHRLYGALALLG
jgi:hypothetical protein